MTLYRTMFHDNINTEKMNRVKSRAERLLRLHQNHPKAHEVNFFGIDLTILPDVFCPTYGEGSRLLAESLDVGTGDRVLEIGTGSGALAILSAKQGAKVVATDISPVAVQCAKLNVERHRLSDRVLVINGDLFQSLKPGEKFSWVLFNPPFLDLRPDNWLERTIMDENHSTLRSFLSDVKSYLTLTGHALVAFSTAGDINFFNEHVTQSKLSINQVCSLSDEFEFFVYELSPKL